MNATMSVPVQVICPDCGPQEHRGHVAPAYVHRDPDWKPGDGFMTGVIKVEYVPKGGVSRYVNPRDSSCPKCGTKETLPYRTELALTVNVAASSYFEKENTAIAVREARKMKEGAAERWTEEMERLRHNWIALSRGKKFPRLVIS